LDKRNKKTKNRRKAAGRSWALAGWGVYEVSRMQWRISSFALHPSSSLWEGDGSDNNAPYTFTVDGFFFHAKKTTSG
jgi:hypothetical protein